MDLTAFPHLGTSKRSIEHSVSLRMPQIDVGIDEVGRGALAGPLVVGAVALSAEAVDRFVSDLLIAVQQKQLKDSKQLTSQERERIFE